ncbi:MAG TPA: ABC transporter ATP-binding protein [Bacillales bacterium]|nr:ABC transporter ATP-binding protein [Bacillales bacterium]
MAEVIAVEGLIKRYDGIEAVKEISFTVEKGEIFGMIGPNGAGKTTTIEILEGLRKRDEGEVRVLGLDPGKDQYQLNEMIGVQFQATSIQELMKVKEALSLFASFYNVSDDEIEKVIADLNLNDKLDTYFKDLSGGWKQRVTLALSVLHKPDIVFLDEPSMGLDPQARRELWEVIRSLQANGTTILVTTHYMEEAERLCDRVAMIYDGRIEALGQPNELLEELATHYLVFESPNAAQDVLRDLPGVASVEHEGEAIRILTEDLQTTSYHLFKEADERRWEIRAFRFERGTLEDLFVHLSGREEVV